MSSGASELPPLDARELERALAELRATYTRGGDNPLGFQLRDCKSCSACMFCTSCTDCYHCTHCEKCVQCTNCTHCKECESCHMSAYCTKSARCVSSKYLEHCENCADCTYCFGCVGLSKKDFHILNQPYDKKTYFEMVPKLRKLLR